MYQIWQFASSLNKSKAIFAQFYKTSPFFVMTRTGRITFKSCLVLELQGLQLIEKIYSLLLKMPNFICLFSPKIASPITRTDESPWLSKMLCTRKNGTEWVVSTKGPSPWKRQQAWSILTENVTIHNTRSWPTANCWVAMNGEWKSVYVESQEWKIKIGVII